MHVEPRFASRNETAHGPNGAGAVEARNARLRKCQTAPDAILRQMPEGAPTTARRTAGLPVFFRRWRALRHLALSGIGALWHSAPSGIPRSLASGAVSVFRPHSSAAISLNASSIVMCPSSHLCQCRCMSGRIGPRSRLRAQSPTDSAYGTCPGNNRRVTSPAV
jgi:hypothetical protein